MKLEGQKLDISAQIKRFYDWLKDNKLSATEISLWHGLHHIANEAGWPEYLSVPISRLTLMTGMKKDAIYSARDTLESKGLIKIVKGRGNQAARYIIIPLIDHEPEEIDELEEDVEIHDSSTTEPPVEPHEEEKPHKTVIFKKIQQLVMMPSPIDIQQMKDYLSEGMEDRLLCEAINIAQEKLKNKKPMDKWKYAKGIMRTWYNNGIKTYIEYQEHEKEREAQINGGNKQSGNNVRPDQKPRSEPKTSGMRKFRVPGEPTG